jgi:hypothetical protein
MFRELSRNKKHYLKKLKTWIHSGQISKNSAKWKTKIILNGKNHLNEMSNLNIIKMINKF